ncbi:Preprotein translocase subunit SecA [Cupriavidus oxalaticus]
MFAEETPVLSHHEFATLVLVNDSSDPPELDRTDVEALLAHQLITLERVGPSVSRPQVTLQGYRFLKALGRIRAKEPHTCR